MSALTPDRKPAAMANTLIGANLDLALDVLLNLSAKVPLNLVVGLNQPANLGGLVLGQVFDLGVGVQSQITTDLMGTGESDPKDVRQANLEALVAGKINAGDTSHNA
jgi:hypothetical protein